MAAFVMLGGFGTPVPLSPSISLKACVDKENKRVVFIESNEEFFDILFSFLTMPMGTIVRLTRDQPPKMDIGCMNNLYKSAEDLDVLCFQTKPCKTMLLNPQNAAAAQCKCLKLNIDNTTPLDYFVCSSSTCTYNLLSHYPNLNCWCGQPMNLSTFLSETNQEREIINGHDKGVFVKGLTQLLLSDDLQVLPPSIATSFSLLSKLGVLDSNVTEEKTFDIGVDKVVNLLKCSLLSSTPLTETLMPQDPVPNLSEDNFKQGSFPRSRVKEEESKGNMKICIKLMVSKAKQIVCCAEAGEDFVDLIVSFLAIPLGHVVKEMQGGSLDVCVSHLYKSIQDLGVEEYFKSIDHKDMVINPKLAPNFGYEKQPLQIEQVVHPTYYYVPGGTYPGYYNSGKRASDRTMISTYKAEEFSFLMVRDPKSRYKEDVRSGGFVLGPAMFTITDDMVITPMSAISGLSFLNRLNVPISDIEERVVHVRNEEASRLLVASFTSKSALTNVFLPREPKQE